MAEFKGKKVIFSPHIHLSGITPTGNINITDTNQTDVTNYATAQIVDANLIPENIAQGVTILGVVGTHSGGGNQPQLNAPSISLSGNTVTITNPATNGNFVSGYKVYANGTLLGTTNTTTYDLSSYAEGGATSASITATAVGTNFLESEQSTAKTWYSNFISAGVYQSKGQSGYNTMGAWANQSQNFTLPMPISFTKSGTSYAGTGIKKEDVTIPQDEAGTAEIYGVCNGTDVKIGTWHKIIVNNQKRFYITLDLISNNQLEVTESTYEAFQNEKFVFDLYFTKIA